MCRTIAAKAILLAAGGRVRLPAAVAENQPDQNRMNSGLSDFAARLRRALAEGFAAHHFDSLARELFALQFEHNAAYRKLCQARQRTPPTVEHWTQIPFVPTAAFKEWELSCLPPAERTAVFHSSGTTEQKPSRHFHHAESLALYEASLWTAFRQHACERFSVQEPRARLICLTPPPSQAPHSSLVHMFETLRRKLGAPESAFVGKVSGDSWVLDFTAAQEALATAQQEPATATWIWGTAFSFVHLLDYLAGKNRRLRLPKHSLALETGGYKNRSRALPKSELHGLIEQRLGIPRGRIHCEYGMCELSSQAYAVADGAFQFPPWARAQIVSPETGREAADGQAGFIRIFDLANVFSVAAVQTEDWGVRRGDGFELRGRAAFAEPRGCSLMSAAA
jgi:hypothetical protein